MIAALALALVLFLLFVGAILRRRRARRRRAAMTQQLYAWAEQSQALEPELQQWLRRLPAPDAAALMTRLDGHCAELNWELNWLFTPALERAPVLHHAVETVVAAYARGVMTGVQMEDEVRAYHVYLGFVRKPMARKRRALVQSLYTQLRADGLMTPEASSVRRLRARLPSGGRKRDQLPARKRQVAAIQQAFDADPARAMELLKRVVTAEADASVPDSGAPLRRASGTTVAPATSSPVTA